jgi:deoxyribodipyrimidine photo-lyase
MVIYWHKRDFRLFDNEALCQAMHLSISENIEFIPLMGLEKDLIESENTSYEFSEFQQFGLLSAMLPLYQNYKYNNIQPILFYDSIIDTLEKINSIENSRKIKFLISHEEAGTFYTYARDKKVSKYCRENNIKWIQIPHSGIVRNLETRDKWGLQVKNYLDDTILNIPDFKNIKEKLQDENLNLKLEKEFKIDKKYQEFTLLKNEIVSKYGLKECSEKVGLQTLKSFVEDRASGYRGGISSPNSAITHGSRLSQFLSYGSISMRYVHSNYTKYTKLSEDKKIRAGLVSAMPRLHWRGHFVQRIESDSTMPWHAINSEFNEIQYINNQEYFEKYKTGMTGEVLIDACMRCLNKTGFINFRMRALLVSYGVFGLDLDWRVFGRYLASKFLDYEPGIHWSQMQMQAGITGINTIRVYSPQKQLIDQDPNCTFVRKWIPELNSVSNEDILNYTNISLAELSEGKYIDPIVNFKEASKINKLKTFGVRKVSSREIAKKVFDMHGSRKLRVKKESKETFKKVSKNKKENTKKDDSNEMQLKNQSML